MRLTFSQKKSWQLSLILKLNIKISKFTVTTYVPTILTVSRFTCLKIVVFFTDSFQVVSFFFLPTPADISK